MRTPKENLLRLMSGDDPSWLGDPWDCFCRGTAFRPAVFDAVTLSICDKVPQAEDVCEKWSRNKHEQRTGSGIVTDIVRWRDDIRHPRLEHLGWSRVKSMNPGLTESRNTQLLMVPSFTGIQEFAYFVLGPEAALRAAAEELEMLFELLDSYTDWKIRAISQVIDTLRPDAVYTTDDWGDENGLYLGADTWRRLILPHYRRFFGCLRSRGVLIVHHNSALSSTIHDDIAELGITIWHGVTPRDDIPAIIKKHGSRICLFGGIDMDVIDRADAGEAEIRAEVRRAIDAYIPLGSFVPCPTTVTAENEFVADIVSDELVRYGTEYALKHFSAELG